MNRREALHAAQAATKSLTKLKRKLDQAGDSALPTVSRAAFDDLHARVTHLGEIIKSVQDESAA